VAPSTSSTRAAAALPALCAATEATWLSLSLSTLVNGSKGATHVSLPYLALALPMVVAAAGAWWLGQRDMAPWRRWLTVAVVAVVGMAVTAGVVSALSAPSAIGRAMTDPFALAGSHQAAVAGGAWALAIIAWGRGTWLGSARVRLTDTVVSLSIGAGVFVLLVLVAHNSKTPAIRQAIGAPGLLLCTFLILGALSVALINRQEVEEATTVPRPSGATLTWLTVLAVPVLAVALIGLVVTAAVGPVAPEIGRGVASAANAVGGALAAAAAWLWHLVAGHPRHVAPRVVKLPPGAAPHKVPTKVSPLRIVILVALVAIGLWELRRFSPRLLRWVGTRTRRTPGDRVDDQTRERRSWNFHLGSPLSWGRHLLARLRRRLGRAGGPAEAGAGARSVPAPLAPVRRSYRQVLADLARRGQGRAPTETVRELETRLRAWKPEVGADLATLSALYERNRYSTAQPTDPEVEQAEAAARSIVERLGADDPVATGPANRVPAGRGWGRRSV
jgi:hypothetical protein